MEDNNFPDVIEQAMRDTIQHGLQAGAQALEPIAAPFGDDDYPRHTEHVDLIARTRIIRAPAEREPCGGAGQRVHLSPIVAARVFASRAWQCIWCGAKTVDGSVLMAVGDAFPHLVPYHKNDPALMHPVMRSRWVVVEHLEPGSRSGRWTDEANLGPACWLCNEFKSDRLPSELGWSPIDEPAAPAWRGLTDLLVPFKRSVSTGHDAPDAPTWRVTRQPVSARVERLPAVQAACDTAAPDIRLGIERLEAFGLRHGLSVTDKGSARRIGDDPQQPMLWIYPAGKPRAEVSLHLLSVQHRDRLRSRLAVFHPSHRPTSSYLTIPLQTVSDCWEKLAPVLDEYIKAATG